MVPVLDRQPRRAVIGDRSGRLAVKQICQACLWPKIRPFRLSASVAVAMMFPPVRVPGY